MKCRSAPKIQRMVSVGAKLQQRSGLTQIEIKLNLPRSHNIVPDEFVAGRRNLSKTKRVEKYG